MKMQKGSGDKCGELGAQAEALANAPHIGMPTAGRPGTRFFPFGLYLIIYRAFPKFARKAPVVAGHSLSRRFSSPA